MIEKSPSQEAQPPLKLVPLAEDHLDRVVEIERQCFSEPWRKEDFQRLLQNPDSICLVALVKGEVVGYSCCWLVCETAELGNIAVAPDYQGRSVGRRLLERTLKLCRKNKVSAVFLEVRCSNIRAIELYRRFGFRKVGLRRNYYTHPLEDALIMKLEF